MPYVEWDSEKAAKNLRDRGVDYRATRAALIDFYAIEEEDQVVDGELQMRAIGLADDQVILLVVHTNRPAMKETDEIARIIHARKASPGEEAI